MTEATTTQISKVDRDAFERAITIMVKHRDLSRDFKRRLDEQRQPWADIVRHAALGCQIQTMGLKPWQVPRAKSRSTRSIRLATSTTGRGTRR
jgi:hypothetical protein